MLAVIIKTCHNAICRELTPNFALPRKFNSIYFILYSGHHMLTSCQMLFLMNCSAHTPHRFPGVTAFNKNTREHFFCLAIYDRFAQRLCRKSNTGLERRWRNPTATAAFLDLPFPPRFDDAIFSCHSLLRPVVKIRPDWRSSSIDFLQERTC